MGSLWFTQESEDINKLSSAQVFELGIYPTERRRLMIEGLINEGFVYFDSGRQIIVLSAQ